MHYHQYEFIKAYMKGVESILIFGDRPVNLPELSSILTFAPLNVSGFLRGKGYEVSVADNDWYEKSAFKPSQTYDLILDFRELCTVPKETAFILLKNIQKAMGEDSVAIHFSPMKGHFPGLHRVSDLSLEFWGKLLANDSILETRTQAAHHNTASGMEIYIAYKKQARNFTKKKTLELLETV